MTHMSVESLPREYHMISRQRTIASVAAGAWLLLITGGLWAGGDDVSAAARLIGTVLAPVLFAWLTVALRRSGTYVDLDGVRVRGVLLTRRLRWAELHDIRVESNTEASPLFGQPATLAYAYRRDGRRIQLLYFDENQPVFQREVELVRNVWQELRGPDWAPSPEARAADARRRDRRLLIGTLGPVAVFLPFVVLLLVR
ncbi:PH domain-containing protein [Streptomyces sp. 8K308]|uniref:PH domain-containing protein n=1 Tax=Streptomyces sp. 8K308 TaxID=2530388 RepID=UPI0014046E6C|nr:PH domain-containing protein [Streptomyces sp. 8K308]